MATIPRSASIERPLSIATLRANGPGARAATFLLTLDATHQKVTCDLSQLPPPMNFDAIGSVFVDNFQGTGSAFLFFPDTQAVIDIPAGTQAWIVGLTGGLRFDISAPFLTGITEMQMPIQVTNFLVQPNGPNTVNGTFSGSVTVTSGAVGPLPGAALDITGAAIPATTNTVIAPALTTRQFLQFQMPQASDGWVNFTGSAASVAGAGCFFMVAGEKYSSIGSFVPTNQVSVYLTGGGVVPVIEA